MSKETKNESLFEAINESELVTISGGGSSANGGNGGSVGHSGNATVIGGYYKGGDGGNAISSNYENENASDSSTISSGEATLSK
jgi:hypothetical protein